MSGQVIRCTNNNRYVIMSSTNLKNTINVSLQSLSHGLTSLLDPIVKASNYRRENYFYDSQGTATPSSSDHLYKWRSSRGWGEMDGNGAVTQQPSYPPAWCSSRQQASNFPAFKDQRSWHCVEGKWGLLFQISGTMCEKWRSNQPNLDDLNGFWRWNQMSWSSRQIVCIKSMIVWIYWDWSSQSGTAEQYEKIHHFEVSTRCLAIHSDAPAFLVTQWLPGCLKDSVPRCFQGLAADDDLLDMTAINPSWSQGYKGAAELPGRFCQHNKIWLLESTFEDITK